MTVTDIVIGLIVALAVGAAIVYIIRSKKKGVKCIGCPEGVTCAQKNKGGCTCSIPEDFEIKK